MSKNTLKNALKFYADEDHWRMVPDADSRGMHNAVEMDRGAIARAALKQAENEDNDQGGR